jgi:Alginate lyase
MPALEEYLTPNTVVLNGPRLLEIKLHLRLGDVELESRLGYLTAQADKWLKQGPWSVTDKAIYPPSGDKHDYASQAPYWWRSDTSTDLPYIQRDGQRNPEVDEYTDHAARRKLFKSSLILSLAWYYTGKEEYAKHAGNIIRTWFLSEESRMKPNLNHAQIIPGINTGRYIGIIDFSQGYTSVLDAAAILAAGAPGWTKSDASAFHSWNAEFLDWLSNSSFGIEESAAKNNHGTFASMQKAAIALFIGREEMARHELQLIQSRIKDDVYPDGSQPKELERTRSWHYSIFNLTAFTRAAAIGRKVGLDLWGYKGPEGQSLHGAVDFIIPAAIGTARWKFPEMSFETYAASDVIHASAEAGNPTAENAVGKIQASPDIDLWMLRPAVEQLDDIGLSKVQWIKGR